jgi:ubiquitin carboxyl-terminal hydrolase 25/28
VQDILLYDPAHPSSTGRNLLSEVPPVYSERYNGALDFISPSACRHNYVTKPKQIFHAQEDQKRRPGCTSKVHAMCTKCRCHIQIVVNYTNGMNTFSQNLEGHIHHLVYKSGRQAGGSSSAEVTPKGQLAETFHYQCSHLSCPAIVSLRILSPLLNPELVHLLTDQDVIHKRAQEAMAAQPERLEGMASPGSATVLDNLRLYVSNTLKMDQPSKAITAINKRFMLSFGVDGMPCQKLFEFLNFTYQPVCPCLLLIWRLLY